MPPQTPDVETKSQSKTQEGNPKKREELVISGISGKFPESDNIQELWEHLLNKDSLIRVNNKRWEPEFDGTYKEQAKINDLSKFDAEFFDIDEQMANFIEPQNRLLWEVVLESIYDAGINPRQLRGSRTGMFVGLCGVTSSVSTLHKYKNECDKVFKGTDLFVCCSGIMNALDLKGPTVTLDTACSASLSAFDTAYSSIQSGECDAAIVATCTLILDPISSYQFVKLGTQSSSGITRPFDAEADGYVRGESIVSLFMQKSSQAKRNYATILNTRVNEDGYKEQGITFPSKEMQEKLVKDVYNEIGMDLNDVYYVEAHGTATKIGDPEECCGIDDAFCKDREGPLYIGSIKSNLGHTEGSSGLVCISKVVRVFEEGVIPPTINYNTPNPKIPGLIDGRLKVVEETIPLLGDVIGINNFGFGGGNAHVALRRNLKEKSSSHEMQIPCLVAVSGRTKEAVEALLNEVEKHPDDMDLCGLLHELFAESHYKHKYRGYLLFLGNRKEKKMCACSEENRPVWFVCSGLGGQWSGMGKDLMRLSVFEETIKRCAVALKSVGFDLLRCINHSNDTMFEDFETSVVTATAIQVGLITLLDSMNIHPDGIVGLSIGEIACAYADGCLTAEQAVMVSYQLAHTLKASSTSTGKMFIVGLPWDVVKARCPKEVTPAFHNASDVVTVSGPQNAVLKFIKNLEAENVFCTEVKSMGIALHSSSIANTKKAVQSAVHKAIPTPKSRSKRWISSGQSLQQTASAEYFANNLVSPVLFENDLQRIPSNAILIEIAPHGLMQTVLRTAVSKGMTIVSLGSREALDNAQYFLSNVARLYMCGLNPKISQLYPPVSFPVHRGTPSLAHLMKWDHSISWRVPSFEPKYHAGGTAISTSVSLGSPAYAYIEGHNIDGRVLYPATGYLDSVWRNVCHQLKIAQINSPIVFEDVQFRRATVLSPDGSVNLVLNGAEGMNIFEICDGDTLVASGKFYFPENVDTEMLIHQDPKHSEPSDGDIVLKSEDVYKELRLRGYNYTGLFQGMKELNVTASSAKLAWNDNWAAFMDTMLQISCLNYPDRYFALPTSIRKVVINPRKHLDNVKQLTVGDTQPEIPVFFHRDLSVIKAGGIEITDMKATIVHRRPNLDVPLLEDYKFVPYINTSCSTEDVFNSFMGIIIENVPRAMMKLIEVKVDEKSNRPLICEKFVNVLKNYPEIDSSTLVMIKSLEGVDKEPVEKLGVRFIERDPMNGIGDGFQVVMGVDASTDLQILGRMAYALKPRQSFLLLEESANLKISSMVLNRLNIEVIAKHVVNDRMYALIWKKPEAKDETHNVVIQINNDEFSWIEEVKKNMKEAEEDKNKRIILVSNDRHSGVLGLVNCLRKEPGGSNLCVVFLPESGVPAFNLKTSLYRDQLKYGLAVNVYKNKSWGSYVHLPINDLLDKSRHEVEHAELDILQNGDLSTLTWVDSPLKLYRPKSVSEELCRVYYSGINFKDILVSSGKLIAVADNTSEQIMKPMLGLEFSGLDRDGKRVMGFGRSPCLATTVIPCYPLVWEVPKSWTLEEAATVPVVYSTVYFGLMVRGRMKNGESILIHAGSGGIGISAITVALSMGCTVYTTVGTPEKRKFIKDRFPQLNDNNIANSRDCTFEQQIMKETNGRGVDLVLNSLAGDKLQASFRCLAHSGRFIEIGKMDFISNTMLDELVFPRNIELHSVQLDDLLKWGDTEAIRPMLEVFQKALDNDIIKPLPTNVYAYEEVEQAFRFIASGKHIGKVVIKMREEEPRTIKLPVPNMVLAMPKTYFRSDRAFIIIGGLGGFGMELAGWMIDRGARLMVLTSRSGVTTGYQKACILRWQNKGATIVTSTADACSMESASQLLSEASKLGTVGGIFNLALVLRDNLMENQTEEQYQEVWIPKVHTTRNMDELSRKHCPQLDYFVCFSSASAGKGNQGQSNYGFANSVMERICETRQSQGLPGLAIQWGAIGDVGVVAEKLKSKTALKLSLQPIVSCLKVMDAFLQQKSPVVSSIQKDDSNSQGELSILQKICLILGIRDAKTLNPMSTLVELGMDSMMNVEVQKILEYKYDVQMSAAEVRQMTIQQLQVLEGA